MTQEEMVDKKDSFKIDDYAAGLIFYEK